jgi:glycosyltransferase involved in cell wall biosynthesis
MTSSPLVSIGLPVYNGEETIERAINSLLGQSYQNLEIVISDNGSTDGTSAILERYREKDPRIRIFKNNVNRGSIWNFKKVFEESSGKYFMWAAHDDHHENRFVSLCVEAMEMDDEAVLCAPKMQMTAADSEEVVWVSCMDSFKDKKSLLERYRETLRHFPAVSIYGLHRRSALAKTELFPKVIGGDLLLNQEMSLLGTFIGVREVLFTRHGRAKWNSIDQDYMTFFGRPKKPIWYSPFLMIFVRQVRNLLGAKVPPQQRLALLSTLMIYQFEQFYLKLSMKLLKYVLPERLKLPISKFIYWKFMNGPNVTAVNKEIFLERIIKPRIGWFS